MKKSIYILCGVGVLVVCAAYACEGCSEYMREKEREKEKIERYNALMERLRTRGIYLNGEDYTLDELNAIEGNYFADRSLREKMIGNGDAYYINW